MRSCWNYGCRLRKNRVDVAHTDPPPAAVVSGPQLPSPTPVPTPILFPHSNLHVLFNSDEESHPFSQIVIFALVKRFNTRWGFNHLRFTNLSNPSFNLKKRPLMELPTSTLLIMNHFGDDLKDDRCQLTLKRYFMHVDQNSSLLVLLNVPSVYRCIPGVFHRSRRRIFEEEQKRFLVNLVPALGGRHMRVTACCASNSEQVVQKIIPWIRKHNKPIMENVVTVAPVFELTTRPSSSVQMPASTMSLLRTRVLPKKAKKKKVQEYEDLPNWRLESSRKPLRASKSLSATEMRLAAVKSAPQRRPEEPRYDAEYDLFRSRRETRRFVRRLRDAMREFRRIAGAASRAGHDSTTSQHTYSESQRTPSGLTGLTDLTNISMLHSDIGEENEDMDHQDEPMAPHVSVTSSLAAQIEPVMFTVRLTNTGAADTSINVDRYRPPLPADSMETLLLNPNIFRSPGTNAFPPPRPVPSNHRLQVISNPSAPANTDNDVAVTESGGFVVGGSESNRNPRNNSQEPPD